MQESFITPGAACFWCIEAAHRQVRGVTGVEVGYVSARSPVPV
ncbi:peptide-methionine (S)-S-oxide reductase [Azotobacter vinelandii]